MKSASSPMTPPDFEPVQTTAPEKGRRETYDDRESKLEYMEQMLRELRLLAVGISESTLAYLLEMAILEAGEALHVHRFRDGLAEDT
ncbi:MAG: hypothetical protein WBO55_00570 [Rhizobiaceae bacterium]